MYLPQRGPRFCFSLDAYEFDIAWLCFCEVRGKVVCIQELRCGLCHNGRGRTRCVIVLKTKTIQFTKI